MPLRLIIRAVPERADCIAYLRRHLPYAEWCFDERRDAWDTFIRALRMAGEDPAVHLEEDILLTRQFRAELDTAIAEYPFAVQQFFSMRKADVTHGTRWDRNYLMNQCFYLPPTYSRQVADYAATWPRRAEHPTGTDTMLNDFLKHRKEGYLLRVPSLVQHREIKSAINARRSSKRQSLTFRDPLP